MGQAYAHGYFLEQRKGSPLALVPPFQGSPISAHAVRLGRVWQLRQLRKLDTLVVFCAVWRRVRPMCAVVLACAVVMESVRHLFRLMKRPVHGITGRRSGRPKFWDTVDILEKSLTVRSQ